MDNRRRTGLCEKCSGGLPAVPSSSMQPTVCEACWATTRPDQKIAFMTGWLDALYRKRGVKDAAERKAMVQATLDAPTE